MPDWNELFKENRNVVDAPDAFALDFIRVLPAKAVVLDLGSGAGRHLPPLVGAGHAAIAFDISPRGLHLGRERLREDAAAVHCVLGDFRDSLPFPEAVFDGILSIRAVNHATPDQVRTVFAEAARITKPGGCFYGTVISTLDARYGDGEEIAEHTFVHDRPPETGVPHHYFSESALLALLKPFSSLDLSLVERVVSPDDPIFGKYRFQAGVAPVLRHWNFRALR